MAVRERANPADVKFLTRGELDTPGDVVPRGFITVCSDENAPKITSGSGRREPLLVAVYTICVSLRTGSTTPMYSGKGLKLRHRHLLPALLLVGLLFTLIVGYPWQTLSLLVIGYICSIPFSIRSHRRHKARAQEEAGEPVDRVDDSTKV